MDTTKIKPIYKEKYILFLAGVPLVLGIVTAGLIIIDLPSSFCWTKKCLDFFIILFELPIKLLGVALATTGIALAFYRSGLTYEQNQHQLEQFALSTHQSFKEEFISLLDRKENDYFKLQLRPEWLFSVLYPHSKQGNNNLNPEFSDFIQSDIYQYQDFFSAMKEIEKGVNSPDETRYYGASYQITSTMSLWLKEFVAIDMNVNLGRMSGQSFHGQYADDVIGLTKDIFHIVYIVNFFEGWEFFDNKQRRLWRINIDKLGLIAKESEQLSKVFEDKSFQAWRSAFYIGERPKFNASDPLILGFLPEGLRNNNAAKQYFYHRIVKHSVNDKSKQEELAKALNIKFKPLS